MKTNKEYLKEYNSLKNDSSLLKKSMLNSLAFNCYIEAMQEGRHIKEYDVKPNIFNVEEYPTLFIIGKANKEDEVLYIVGWHSYYKKNKCSDDIRTIYKMYNRKQIDYFKFDKIKECII